MTHPTAFFDDIEALAAFCAALLQRGIAFHSRPTRGGYEVTLTGY